MAWGRIKSEHGGAKRGKGYWGRKAEAKQASRRAVVGMVEPRRISLSPDRANQGIEQTARAGTLK